MQMPDKVLPFLPTRSPALRRYGFMGTVILIACVVTLWFRAAAGIWFPLCHTSGASISTSRLAGFALCSPLHS
jgi:hypothetical protein